MYEKFANWKNFPDESTPITAAALTHIEQGITDVDITRDGTPAEVELSSRLSAAAGSAEGMVQAERAAREAALELKSDKAAVYTKAETYSRAETGTQITNAITASRPPLYGTGFPNGVVAAPVGTLYSDAAVTNGASLWQKVSGTGNTGWEVARGDTGVRNVSALLGPDWTLAGAGGAMLTLQRVGSRVTLRFGGKSVAAKNYAPLLVLPTGFRVAGFGVLGGASVSGAPFTQLSVGIWANLYTVALGPGPVAEGTSVTGFAVAETFDPWPAALPGTN